jgi:hypothetical protein
VRYLARDAAGLLRFTKIVGGKKGVLLRKKQKNGPPVLGAMGREW